MRLPAIVGFRIWLLVLELGSLQNLRRVACFDTYSSLARLHQSRYQYSGDVVTVAQLNLDRESFQLLKVEAGQVTLP